MLVDGHISMDFAAATIAAAGPWQFVYPGDFDFKFESLSGRSPQAGKEYAFITLDRHKSERFESIIWQLNRVCDWLKTAKGIDIDYDQVNSFSEYALYYCLGREVVRDIRDMNIRAIRQILKTNGYEICPTEFRGRRHPSVLIEINPETQTTVQQQWTVSTLKKAFETLGIKTTAMTHTQKSAQYVCLSGIQAVKDFEHHILGQALYYSRTNGSGGGTVPALRND